MHETTEIVIEPAPVTWNSLPANITLSDSEHGFKRQLKTFLFQQSA